MVEPKFKMFKFKSFTLSVLSYNSLFITSNKKKYSFKSSLVEIDTLK